MSCKGFKMKSTDALQIPSITSTGNCVRIHVIVYQVHLTLENMCNEDNRALKNLLVIISRLSC